MRDRDHYELVESDDRRSSGRKPRQHDYTLEGLDRDWHSLIVPHLPGRDMMDSDLKGARGFDTVDAKGKFQKAEVQRELKRLSREELENSLGIPYNKIDEILRRADVKRTGEIEYKKFLETVRAYRLSSEHETKLKSYLRIFAYTEEFSCVPPTFVMITITLVELCLFIVTSMNLEQNYGETIGWSSPVPYCSHLIYNPKRRWEAWRYFTYMFVHIGLSHFIFNMIMQLIVGVSLEMSQVGILGSFRVLAVYLAGVLAASLGTSISDPAVFIAGASGGVYSLIAAHLATMALNWQEDSSVRIQKVVHKPITRTIRIVFISLLCIHDIGHAIYVRFNDPLNRTGFVGHLCGALAGLLVGIFVLDNRRVRKWEPVVQILSFVLFCGLCGGAIVWNIWGNTWSPDFFPNPDPDLYEPFGKCRNFQTF